MKKVRAQLIGEQFGRLTVISFSHVSESKDAHWICKCSCGKQVTQKTSVLRSGNTKSCGCLHLEWNKNGKITHGQSRTPEYEVWLGIIKRTENVNSLDYKYYGGRGIKMSKKWREDFKNFLIDMGKRPSPKHSIERINNNGHYCKRNCKWADAHEQNRNKRNNVYVRYKNRVMILQDWANELGLTKEGMKYRISKDKNYKIL